VPLNTQCYLYRCCCIDISRASVHTDAGDTSASVLAGSSVDDQSSVAGHADSERDQTVSSPLHPSAAPQRSPTPDPPVTHQPRASSSHRPASAAPKVTTGVPFFSAKAAVQSQASAATIAAADEAAKAAAADAKSNLVNAASMPSASEGDAPVVADPKKDAQHASSAAARASSSGQQSSMKDFLQGQGTQKGPAPGPRPSTAPASPAPSSGKIQKPSRCQKCHTCRHKQLKKQCLRNKVGFLLTIIIQPGLKKKKHLNVSARQQVQSRAAGSNDPASHHQFATLMLARQAVLQG